MLSTLWRVVGPWLVLLAVVSAGPVAAPAYANGENGSWTGSCDSRSVDLVNHVVAGRCGIGGNLGIFATRWRHTTLIRTDLCAAGIYNDHGHLKCERYPQNSWGIPQNAASTCNNGFTVDNRYWAKCKRKSADHWNWTSVAVQTCNSASNSDGTLSCSANYYQTPGTPTLPVKSWPLCYLHGNVRQTVSEDGQTPDQAIAAFRQGLPNNGVGDIVQSGACP